MRVASVMERITVKRNGGNYNVFIDKSDTTKVSSYTWWMKDNGYIYTQLWFGPHTKRKSLYLHRFLMGLDFGDSLTVDHINGNKLDNRKENLRVVSFKTNNRNKNKVCGIRVKNGGFHCRISWRDAEKIKHEKHLGVFGNIRDAIIARMKAEKEIFGEISNSGVFKKALCQI